MSSLSTAPLRRRFAGFAAVIALLIGPAAAQEPLRIQFEVRGVEALEALSADILPEKILADPEVSAIFDIGSRRWVIALRPAHAYLTELTVAFSDHNRTIPKPPLRMALPYDGGDTSVIEITIPNIVEPDPAYVLAVYRNLAPATHERERLVDFLHASALIDYLAEGHTTESVPITPPLMRSLIVYAARLDQLLASSEWFGIPTNVNDRAEMIRRSVSAARSDAQLANNIRMNSLEESLAYVRRAESQIYIRAWRALDQRPLHVCNEDLPILISFYSHLKQLDPETYASVVEEGRFRLRTHVLLRSTECFRRLITIGQDNTRTVYPSVAAGPFGDRTLSEMAEMIEQELYWELRSLQTADLASDPVSPDCSEPASNDESYICDSIEYIRELIPLIKDEVSG